MSRLEKFGLVLLIIFGTQLAAGVVIFQLTGSPLQNIMWFVIAMISGAILFVFAEKN